MPRARRLTLGIAGLTILGPILACGIGAEHAAEIRTLAAACDGTPAPGAPAYTPGPGEHPILALERYRVGGPWTQSLGRLTTRTPGGHDVASTQLVLCQDAEEHVELERCAFDTQLRIGLVPVPGARTEGPTFPRVRSQRRVRVVATATAQTVGEQLFDGGEPPACDHSITGHPSDSDFRGASVSNAVIDAWAETYGLGTAP